MKKIFNFIYFYLVVILRFFIILIKRKKRLERISLGFFQKWHFQNSFLCVDFNFKNALWFQIGEYKSIDFSKQMVLDLENIPNDIIFFEIYGFFQKQVYSIKLEKENRIDTESFKITIANKISFELVPKLIIKSINSFVLKQPKAKTKMPEIELNRAFLSTNLQSISIQQHKVETDFKPFKIQEYL